MEDNACASFCQCAFMQELPRLSGLRTVVKPLQQCRTIVCRATSADIHAVTMTVFSQSKSDMQAFPSNGVNFVSRNSGNILSCESYNLFSLVLVYFPSKIVVTFFLDYL